jgi:ferrochelatase
LEHARKVASQLGENYLVVPAMRYQEPSLAQAVQILASAGVERVIAFPLYPQYSLSATQSSVVATQKLVDKMLPGKSLTFIPAFYDRPEYLDAVTEVSRPHLKPGSYDRVLFSYHGLPERQVKATDDTGAHCLANASCCDRIEPVNRDCYRAQCYATTRELASRLGLAPESYEVGFQSRLGRTPWIRPYSDDFYRDLPKQGVKRLAVLSPSFVADCLETLEEVQMRGQEEFQAAGGESLTLVPSLNGSDAWAKAAAKIIRTA